ncbi:TRAP transporter small permease subunit [Pikeienuella piscinae]|uniref:TRAP transporter small permease protein n=1 Tax=Pikeienuella piscinae TaxID=2748098 RepID=A0A7L5BWY8_9RHOB|nr:TRAP transporter small permease subunit [Pikeienuella piscinae]QIE55047.1 TRAP transporter small permease subunit [Pikeienuella piscinae]
MKAVRILDLLLTRGLSILCGLLLAAMVLFTIYTVVMRTVFLAPPFWGDTLTLFANIWLVMLAFAMAVRARTAFAIESLYGLLPERLVNAARLLWLILFALVGALMAIWGFAAADRIMGAYWELGNLPKSYPMMILPIAGVLVFLASALTIAEHLGLIGPTSQSEEEQPQQEE